METAVSKISKNIQKYEEQSGIISHDINELLDSSNKVKKHFEVLIKLGHEINNSAFAQISELSSCSPDQESVYKNIAALMLVLVEKSKEFHVVFATQEFFKVSLKSTLENFAAVISEMQEAAEDMLSSLALKHDDEWHSIAASIDGGLA